MLTYYNVISTDLAVHFLLVDQFQFLYHDMAQIHSGAVLSLDADSLYLFPDRSYHLKYLVNNDFAY